ncbi:MAG TPA: ATP-binding protein [Planctomycetota bacterium]|nr:ATP-binding protein [Planctomycetota bacterium]
MSGDTPALLIVDDQETNQRLYRAALKDIGAELLAAGSGEESLRLCRQRSFAMILLDVHLSGMNGFEVALRLREAGLAEATPIVFVSAVYVHEANAFRAYRLGAVDYILSPVVPQILRAKAAVFLRLHRMRREAEEQARAMERAYRELRSAHTELEHFSHSVSHDLRTPLGQIAGFAQLLQARNGAQLDDKGRECLEHVIDAARHMNGLIDDLLDLSRMTRSELQGEPVDLSALAREVARSLNDASLARPVQWRVEDGLQVHGDPRLLRAALTNLLGNAWKYTAQQPRPEVTLERTERDGQPVYCVRDNGAGFDVQAAGERLFRPFQRFHPSRQFEGTGIGLAIVQRVVVKHGGEIWAESTPGAGATFCFTLPPLAGVGAPLASAA